MPGRPLRERANINYSELLSDDEPVQQKAAVTKERKSSKSIKTKDLQSKNTVKSKNKDDTNVADVPVQKEGNKKKKQQKSKHTAEDIALTRETEANSDGEDAQSANNSTSEDRNKRSKRPKQHEGSPLNSSKGTSVSENVISKKRVAKAMTRSAMDDKAVDRNESNSAAPEKKQKLIQKKSNAESTQLLAEKSTLQPVMLVSDRVKQLLENKPKNAAENASARLDTGSGSGSDSKWKAKYEALRELRMTEPEQMLREVRKTSSEEREAQQQIIDRLKKQLEEKVGRTADTKSTATASESVVKALKNEITQLKRRNVELEGKLQDSVRGTAGAVSAVCDVAELKTTIAAQQKVISMYHLLSSTQLRIITDEDEDWDPSQEHGNRLECITTNCGTRRGVKYELNVPASVNKDIDFVPTANVHLLPSFMQEDIAFDRQQAPVFLTKVLKALYSS